MDKEESTTVCSTRKSIEVQYIGKTILYRSAVGSADWLRLQSDYIGIVAVGRVAVAAVDQPNTREEGGWGARDKKQKSKRQTE